MKALHRSHEGVIVLACLLALGFGDAQAQDEVDLFIESATYVDPPYKRVYGLGSQVQVQCEITNRGYETSEPYEASYYIRQSGYICKRSHFLDSVTRDPLAPGVIDDFATTVTLPDDVALGYYYIDIVATCPSDPRCNAISIGKIKVARPFPDLTVQAVEAEDGRYSPGAQIKVQVTVENVGAITSGPYTVDVTADGYNLVSISRDGLAPSDTDTFETTGTFPDDLPDGEYAIEATATCPGDDYPDNDSGRDGIVIWFGLLPDLAVQRVEATQGTYHPGDDIVVYSLVENISDRPSASYTVDYYVSPDPEITSRDYPIGYVEREGLAPGQQHSYETTCHLPSYIPAGDCYIGAIITCLDDGRSQNNVGRDDATVTLTHPTGYICGRIRYTDRDSVTMHPVRYAQVEIYEGHDEPGDPEIAHTYTDPDGYFGVVVPHEGQQDRPVFLKVRTKGVSGAYPGTTSTIADVKDDVFERHYFCRSELCELPAQASLVIDVIVRNKHGAFMVYDSLVEGFIKAKTFLGVELDAITTYWPSSYNATFYLPGEAIYISQDDAGDRDVILHEYGHYLAEVYDFAQGSVGEYPQHYWDVDLRYTPFYHTEEQARNFAFREAWPTLFSIATQYGDTWYPNSGDTKYQDFVAWAHWTFEIDLEKDTQAHGAPGLYFENMNCCALWDIFDDHNDVVDNNDILSDTALAKIWTVTRECRPTDIEDFWHGWFEHFDDETEITRIFRDHEMPLQRIPTASGVDFETGDFAPFEWVHSGDAPWFVTAEGAHQGTYCVRAGVIGDGQSSTLKAIVPCDAGEIRFWRKISCQPDWDKLTFYIDGWLKAEWSGELDWEQVSYPVAAGTHTLMWIYIKDIWTSVGDDTVRIDDIEFPISLTAP